MLSCSSTHLSNWAFAQSNPFNCHMSYVSIWIWNLCIWDLTIFHPSALIIYCVTEAPYPGQLLVALPYHLWIKDSGFYYHILDVQLWKVWTSSICFLDVLVKVVCHAIDMCMFMNCCVHTVYGIPCTCFSLLGLGFKAALFRDHVRPAKSKVNPMNKAIGLSMVKLSLLKCKGLQAIANTYCPSQWRRADNQMILRVGTFHSRAIRGSRNRFRRGRAWWTA